MKRILILVFAGLFVLSVVSNVEAQNRDKNCSDRTFKGSYGFISTGHRIGDIPGLRANVGLFTADGKGNISASGTKSKDGLITQYKNIAGTYTVNSDCTGSITWTKSDGEEKYVDFVIVDGNNEIFTIDADDGRVKTGIIKKQ
jgi:hypothetical protein